MSAPEKLGAVGSLLLSSGPERAVSKRWLFRTHSRLYPAFLTEHQIAIERDDEFAYVKLDGQTFVWPAEAAVEPLHHLLAELITADHPHQYDFGSTRLSADDVLLDIGCCEGGFAAKAAEVGASVVAIEPSEVMGKVINRLFDLRGLARPRIEQCLLGTEPGVAYFRDNTRDPAQSQITPDDVPGSYRVPVTTIDELVQRLDPQPTYLKCDAEGADFQILQGGREFLRKARPKIAVAAYHHPHDFARIGDYLRSLGYAVEGKGFMYVAGRFHVVMIHAV